MGVSLDVSSLNNRGEYLKGALLWRHLFLTHTDDDDDLYFTATFVHKVG